MLPATQFCQAAWVVSDLDAAMARWTRDARVGPFFVNSDARTENLRYRGQPASFFCRLALAQAGPIQIELIEQPGNEPSVYRDVVPLGQEGFHHMAAFVDDVDAEFERYAALGAPLAQDGWFGDVRVGYVDTRAQLGFMLEFFNHRPGMDALFAHIADAARNWDGSDPIRPFPVL